LKAGALDPLAAAIKYGSGEIDKEKDIISASARYFYTWL
jgi:hypothetical protein